jgi:hypothetical protein
MYFFILKRRLKWENNKKIINQHNKDEKNGKKTHKLAMNKFGDFVRFSKTREKLVL